MTVCEVDFQRTPGASAIAGVMKMATDAAASVQQKCKRNIRYPPSCRDQLNRVSSATRAKDYAPGICSYFCIREFNDLTQ
jgi:hypothetical protein